METSEAVKLIRDAIPRPGGFWADLGAGEGVFTRALVELLGPDAVVYAVDRDPRAVAALGGLTMGGAARVVPVAADFADSFELPGIEAGGLDGILMANALHFVRHAERTLTRLVTWLRPGGRVVLVEYDRERGNPWVPHPIPAARWPALARGAGLSEPAIMARQASAFGGDMYVAVARL